MSIVFALQEIDKNALKKLSKTFDRLGYKCITTPYCLDAGSFSFMFAYDPKKIEISRSRAMLLHGYQASQPRMKNESHSQKKKNLNDTCRLNLKNPHKYFTIHTLDDGKKYSIANTHPGLTNEHRLLAMHKLVTFMEDRQKRHPEIQATVVVGDMNQFNDKVGRG